MLLDTSVIIDILRRRQPAIEFMKALDAKPSVSVITISELLAGARNRREEGEIDTALSTSRIHPVNEAIARRAGQWLRHYRASHGLNDPDALIAATAEHHGLKLATLNVKHFPMFPKLKRAY